MTGFDRNLSDHFRRNPARNPTSKIPTQSEADPVGLFGKNTAFRRNSVPDPQAELIDLGRIKYKSSFGESGLSGVSWGVDFEWSACQTQECVYQPLLHTNRLSTLLKKASFIEKCLFFQRIRCIALLCFEEGAFSFQGCRKIGFSGGLFPCKTSLRVFSNPIDLLRLFIDFSRAMSGTSISSL